MSDNSSSPESTRSAAAIRQDIADYVLSHADEMSEVPSVKEFVEEHGRLTTEIAAAKKLGKRLAKAKEKYEPFENRVLDRRDALKNAEAELAKSHRPLGEASFQAFLAGDLEDQPAFADRLASHKRIQELHQEHGDLTPATDVGMVQKTKAKAQQLAIAGKVKLEEMKCGGMESDIGRQLIESELVESVRCDSTSSLLEQVADNRESLSACSSQLQEADAAREKATKQLSEAVPLQHIESSKTFDAEIKSCKATIRQSESSLTEAIRSVIDVLDAHEQSKLSDALLTRLNELKTAKDGASEYFKEAGEEFQQATKGLRRGAAGFAESTKRWWGRLSGRGRAITVAVSCFVLMLAALSGSDPSNTTKTETGEIQKNPEAPDLADDEQPSELPPVVGRELRVMVVTVGAENMPGWVQTHNGSLSSVKCHATDSEIVIDFNVDSSKWVSVRKLFPLLIRIFDKNGQYLTRLTTAEGFTTFPYAYEDSNEIYQNLISVGLTDKAQEHNCLLLKPRNNRLTYSVNVRDLRDAAQVEIGFLVR
jgi:hypothetical protein